MVTQVTPMPLPWPTRSMDQDAFDNALELYMAAKPLYTQQFNQAVQETNDNAIAAVAAAFNAANSLAAAQVAKALAEAAAASAIASPGTLATSATSLTVGAGTLAMVIQASKTIAVGMWYNCVRTADRTIRMAGYVDYYNSATGALQLAVSAGNVSGSGTYSDWTLTPAGIPGSILNAVADLTLLGASRRPTKRIDFTSGVSLMGEWSYGAPANLTYFDAVGFLQTATVGQQTVYEYDPVTGVCLGIPRWEARVNYIRNSTAAGAAVGTPGTDPTNWLVTVPAGCAKQVTSVGSWLGIEYFQIRCYGTVSAAGQMFVVHADMNAANGTAANGQTYTHSAFLQLQAGSWANVNLQIGIDEMTAGGAFLTGTSTPIAPNSATQLRAQRYSHTRTLTQATTGALRTAIYSNIAQGAVVDFTLTIGLPQLEQGIGATPPIKTSVGAVARALTALSLPVSSRWYNVQEGTIVVRYQKAFTTFCQAVVSMQNASATDYFMLRDGSALGGNPGSTDFLIAAAGANQADSGGPATADRAFHIMAFAYKTNDCVQFVDGGSIATDTSVTLPSGIDKVLLGSSGLTQDQNPMNGWIASFDYFPVRLTNTELAALSALNAVFGRLPHQGVLHEMLGPLAYMGPENLKGYQEFTVSGTFQPVPGATMYYVECVPGGDGGQAGQGGSTNQSGNAGAGAASATVLSGFIPAQFVTAAVTVTVGAAGNGAGGSAGINTNGTAAVAAPGGVGGDSSFGNFVIAKGGVNVAANETMGGWSIAGQGVVYQGSGNQPTPKIGQPGGGGPGGSQVYASGVGGNGGTAGTPGANSSSANGGDGGHAQATPAPQAYRKVGNGGSGGGSGGYSSAGSGIGGKGGNGANANGYGAGGGGGGGGGWGFGFGGNGGNGGNGSPGIVRVYWW